MAYSLWSDRPLGVANEVKDTEMTRNVAEAAQSAGQITENIDAVAAATNSTTSAMNDAQAAIDEVARMATSLHSSVARFRY
jgi:methyl-accepting chemotaxis protein